MSRVLSKARLKKLKLRLYVAGHATNSVHALASLRAVASAHFPSAYELEVVDMLDHPERARADGVLVTPTLIRLLPSPVQRIVGTLSDPSQLLRILTGK